jgi:hypothetical protein
MNNVLLALDIVNASLKTTAKINEMLMKAQIEGRDITDEELKQIMDENDKKLALFKAGI